MVGVAALVADEASCWLPLLSSTFADVVAAAVVAAIIGVVGVGVVATVVAGALAADVVSVGAVDVSQALFKPCC